MVRRGCSHWLVSATIGFCCAATLAFRLIRPWAYPLVSQVVSVLFLTIVFTPLVYRLLFRVTLPRVGDLARPVRFKWAVLALLIGAFSIFALPMPDPLPRHILEIAATGEKNPLAGSSAVLLWGVFRGDGWRIPLSEYELTGAWDIGSNDAIGSSGSKPALMIWRSTSDLSISLDLPVHPDGGIVWIRWDGQERRIDLYSPDPNATPLRITLSGSSRPERGPRSTLLALGLFVTDAISLGFLVFAGSVWPVTRKPRVTRPIQISRGAWIYYALPCALAWSIYLLAFWPAVMSADSIDQWGQMVIGRFNDHHPIFHTLTMWLLTRLWLSPAIVALAQIVSLSAVVGWGLALVRRMGTPSWIVWVACLIIALSPVNGIWVITLWKDIPYSIAMLALTLLVLLIVQGDGAWLERRGAWFVLGGVAALVALFRHNGIVAAFGTPLVLALVCRRYRRPLIYALVLCGGLWLGFKISISPIAGPSRDPIVNYERVWLIHQVAAHVAAGTPLSAEEQVYLNSILPLETRWLYDCYRAHKIAGDKDFNWSPLLADQGRLIQVSFSLFLRNPLVNFGHLACHSSVVWQIIRPETSSKYDSEVSIDQQNKRSLYVHPNKLGVMADSRLPDLSYQLGQFVLATEQGVWDSRLSVWRPAIYLYVLLAGVAIASVRARKSQVWLIALPSLLHSAFLIVFLNAQDSRFQYPVILVSLVLWAALFQSSLPNRLQSSFPS